MAYYLTVNVARVGAHIEHKVPGIAIGGGVVVDQKSRG